MWVGSGRDDHRLVRHLVIANNVGAHEPLLFAPMNAWAATLILAIALDINRHDVIKRG